MSEPRKWTPADDQRARWQKHDVLVVSLSECGRYARIQFEDSLLSPPRTALVLVSELAARDPLKP